MTSNTTSSGGSDSLKKYFCPRLIDFVIIVGCKQPATPSQLLAKYQQQFAGHLNKSANISLTQKPELLRRYPFEDHADFMLPQDVIYFCQPEGCSNINCSSQTRANAHKDTTSFIFTLTEKDSARVRYGVCINFFRPIEKKYRTIVTSNRKVSTNRVESDDDDDLDESGATGSDSGESNERKRRNKKASDIKYTHTLTSLCIISHHPFFSLFRECLNILRKIIESCHARASTSLKPQISNVNTSSCGLTSDTVWGILTGSSGTTCTEQISSLVSCEIREIETWILRLLSAHVPVPGKTKLIVKKKICDSQIV